MFNSSNTPGVRVLPNNKVYRQLFEAQVQLSDAYNRVKKNQLSQSVNITSRPTGVPLVRNIRPHETQKRQWLTAMSFSNDASINPIAILFHDERKRRQNEQQQELDELKRDVFNLPDRIKHSENEENGSKGDDPSRGNVTERLASNRQAKYTQLWTEFLEKISQMNQNLLHELEQITRQCNTYYEHGDKEIDAQLQNLIYRKDIESLTVESFEHAFNQLDQVLPPRLSQIQEYCQAISDLELDRIHKIRDLFKYYSERLYKTHHLSEKEIAHQLEKQANELNTQILDNRRTCTELEARLLAGETVRAHRYQGELLNYQRKWRDAMWIVQKQIWISKLSQYKAKLEPTILSVCQSIGLDITILTHMLQDHINTLNSFTPPNSTHDKAQEWYNYGCDLVQEIVRKKEDLIGQINEIINNEIDLLQKESDIIRKKVIRSEIYTEEQTRGFFERDIEPIFEERKRYLHEAVINRLEVVYKRLTSVMFDLLKLLLTFIQTPAKQWDNHQVRLEHITSELLDMMRECRRPHDLQNEKKLTKLDATLDEMRSASNETALARLLTSSYEQLDVLKVSYAQFYENEHSIVNKYSNMIAGEVNRYQDELLNCFHARPISSNEKENHRSSSSPHEYHTTTQKKTTYALKGYVHSQMDSSEDMGTSHADEQSGTLSTLRNSSNVHSHTNSVSNGEDQIQAQAFLTEESKSDVEIMPVPFKDAFQLPSNLFDSLTLNLCRSFLDYFDQWKDETMRRAEAVMQSKHDELDKEMDFQMHLHEPRRIRIETDIHNVRTAEIVMHDERVERHIRGVQETLEQTDADYGRMLIDFAKRTITYTNDINSLEQLFVSATTSARLSALQDRLIKQRETFMNQIRTSLRDFRKRFDGGMQYLRQANTKFRKSFKTFADGGNFSREEIEIYRKKLEKTAFQIDKAETTIFKELEKLEKTQLEEANKIMTQFGERFKFHMADLSFIELANRWISEAQVKIKSEVAVNNQQAQQLKVLITVFQTKIDSIINPNPDKQTSSLPEVRELFHQIVLSTYERALCLKCLNNELSIPASILPVLRDKHLIQEEELVNDLRVTGIDESSSSRRPSKASAGVGSNMDEAKSVRFASSSSPTTSSSRRKTASTIIVALTGGQSEDVNTISSIKSLLHKQDQPDSDEIVESGIPAALDPHTRSMVSDSSSEAASTKKPKPFEKNRRPSNKDISVAEERTPALRGDRPSRARTRDEIYGLYCIFGEKKNPGGDFLSKILNILRQSTEGVLSHSEVFYKEKGSRPVTRPEALCEKFNEFAQMMIEKLKSYEQQCRTYHEHSVNEFRELLDVFERASTSIAKIEFEEQFFHAEKVLHQIQQQFQSTLNQKLNETNGRKETNFESLRPEFGHPAKREHLQNIDDREKARQENVQKTIDQLRSNSLEYIQTNVQETINALATSGERLLILFDEILTSDEITRTKIPIVKQSLSELVKRQQAGKPLEDSEPTPLIERKQGHWAGLPLLDAPSNARRESLISKKRSSVTGLRQKTSASIVTQKTTLPQIQTVTQRDQAYQKFQEISRQTVANIEARYSTTKVELDRYRTYWAASIEKLQHLRTD